MTLRISKLVLALCVIGAAFAAGQEAAPRQVEAENDNDADVPAYVAEILSVQGDHAQYTHDDETWQAAAAGIELAASAAIRTGFASRCLVRMGNNSIIQVEPLSSVRLADYAADSESEVVRANLGYGAVRCGVTHSQIETDTAIRTPVSTLSIRGTDVYVEYDPGTRQVRFTVDRDGPALVQPTFDFAGADRLLFQALSEGDGIPAGRSYTLEEGMTTDEQLTRFLELAVMERASFGAANPRLGDISELEALALLFQATGFIDPASGALQFSSDYVRGRTTPGEPVLDDPRSGGGGSTNPFCPVCPLPD